MHTWYFLPRRSGFVGQDRVARPLIWCYFH
jgi:hypothetical protein